MISGGAGGRRIVIIGGVVAVAVVQRGGGVTATGGRRASAAGLVREHGQGVVVGDHCINPTSEKAPLVKTKAGDVTAACLKKNALAKSLYVLIKTKNKNDFFLYVFIFEAYKCLSIIDMNIALCPDHQSIYEYLRLNIAKGH